MEKNICTAIFYIDILVLVLALISCNTPITEEDLIQHIDFFSSDEQQGRLFGSPGIKASEEYLFHHLDKISFFTTPYYQEFLLYFPLNTGFEQIENGASKRSSLASVERDGQNFPIYFDIAHYPIQGSAVSKQAEGNIIFAGYGISAPEYEYDDYEGLDVQGKVVLVLRHEPNEKDETSVFNGNKHTKYAAFKYKVERAGEAGAVGLLLIDDPLNHPKGSQAGPPWGFGFDKYDEADTNSIPALHVSLEYIESVFPDVSFSALQKSLDDGDSPAELTALPSAYAKLSLSNSDSSKGISGRNIILFVPSFSNRTKKMKDERHLIIIGAHHDHLGGYITPVGGFQNTSIDTVYNGADDNASGTAAVLELAENFRRGLSNTGILFVFFSAEELGLFGSQAFVKEYEDLLPRTTAMINFDMIGRNTGKEILMQYSGYDKLKNVLNSIDLNEFSLVRYMGNSNAVSDYFPFFKKGVSTLFFFSGLHDDYHTFDDEADRLNYLQIKTIAEKGAEIIIALDKLNKQYE